MRRWKGGRRKAGEIAKAKRAQESIELLLYVEALMLFSKVTVMTVLCSWPAWRLRGVLSGCLGCPLFFDWGSHPKRGTWKNLSNLDETKMSIEKWQCPYMASLIRTYSLRLRSSLLLKNSHYILIKV